MDEYEAPDEINWDDPRQGPIDLSKVKVPPGFEGGFRAGYSEGYQAGVDATLACCKGPRVDRLYAMFFEFYRLKLFKWVQKGWSLHPPAVQCAYCGRTSDLQIDHIYPKSLGGEDRIGNYQFLCQRCNVIKSNQVEE